MKRKILGLMIVMMGVLGLVASMGCTDVVAVVCKPGTLRESEAVSSYAECNTDASQTSGKVWSTVGAGLNVAMGIMGVLSVIMVIYGGFQYMTSAGDSSKVTKAKNTIIYGIVGLIVVALASAIINLVIKSVLKI